MVEVLQQRLGHLLVPTASISFSSNFEATGVDPCTLVLAAVLLTDTVAVDEVVGVGLDDRGELWPH